MRAYQNTREIAAGEVWPKNVQSKHTGHLPKWVLDALPDIENELLDHIRSWVYVSEIEANNTMQDRLDYLFTSKQSQYPYQFRQYVGEHVCFVIIF